MAIIKRQFRSLYPYKEYYQLKNIITEEQYKTNIKVSDIPKRISRTGSFKNRKAEFRVKMNLSMVEYMDVTPLLLL